MQLYIHKKKTLHFSALLFEGLYNKDLTVSLQLLLFGSYCFFEFNFVENRT